MFLNKSSQLYYYFHLPSTFHFTKSSLTSNPVILQIAEADVVAGERQDNTRTERSYDISADTDLEFVSCPTGCRSPLTSYPGVPSVIFPAGLIIPHSSSRRGGERNKEIPKAILIENVDFSGQKVTKTTQKYH